MAAGIQICFHVRLSGQHSALFKCLTLYILHFRATKVAKLDKVGEVVS